MAEEELRDEEELKPPSLNFKIEEEEYLIFYFLVDTVYKKRERNFLFMGNVARGE